MSDMTERDVIEAIADALAHAHGDDADVRVNDVKDRALSVSFARREFIVGVQAVSR